MTKLAGTTIVVVSLGAVCAGCASAPMQTADAGASATYHAAGVGAYTVKTTGGEIYQGAGRAIKAPLHDLNMMQDQIPPVLLRAEDKPYEVVGLDSCNDVLNKVAELDLALGPDVDMPKEDKKRTRASRGADFAADAALDAAGSAVEHFIPMRGTIKQITGATRYENHVKHAILSGEVRRSFLKTVGMAHNCAWPAAPLDFKPAQVADASASWTAKPMLASAVTTPAAAATAAATAATAVAVSTPATGKAVPAAPATIQTASLTTQSSTSGKRHLRKGLAANRPTETAEAATPVTVASYSVLELPPVAAPPADPSQAWQPPAVSTVAYRSIAAPVTTSAAAPWSAGFGSSMPH